MVVVIAEECLACDVVWCGVVGADGMRSCHAEWLVGR